MLRALLSSAPVACETNESPADTLARMVTAARAVGADLSPPQFPGDHVRLRLHPAGIRNQIYLTLDAQLDGVNGTRLSGRVQADAPMRVLTVGVTLLLLVGIAMLAIVVGSLVGGSGSGASVFLLLWSAFAMVGFSLWIRGLVAAAASLRELLQQAFTKVTMAAA